MHVYFQNNFVCFVHVFICEIYYISSLNYTITKDFELPKHVCHINLCMIQPIVDTYAKTTVYTCISQSSKIQKV